MKWLLFLPFGYGFNTRAKTPVHRLSFLALILAPIVLNVSLMTRMQFDLVIFVLAFLAMYVTYEVGYIFNDVYTANKEKKPTQWLDDDKVAYVHDKFPLLVAMRGLYVSVILVVLYIYKIPNYELFIIGLALMTVAFSFHNYFRGKQNVFTDGALQFFKYTIVLLPFGAGMNLALYVLFIYFEIAFERTLEFAIGKKHFLKVLQKYNIDNLRIVYYIILFILSMILIAMNKEIISLAIGTFYLLLYRVFCKLLTLNKSVRIVRKSNSKETKNE